MTNGYGAPVNSDDILRKSVTRGDYNAEPTSAVMHWIIPNFASGDRDLPTFWSYSRDMVLASTLYRESLWADAVSIAIAKIAARGFDVDSDIPLRAKRAQDLFLNFDSGHGYVSGLQKHLQNFLLTGNGGHVEIVRATRALGSRIIGLVPLDTFRCRRTGDPDFPIIYRDRMGREHIMREWDVFSLTDMPDPADTWYGLGHCAAERAYKAIIKLEAIERYILDKVSGQRILAFHIVGGVSSKNLDDAKLTAQGEAQAKGVTNYMGAAIIAMMGDTPASIVTIPLAELPDGFNRKEEWDIAITTYARALGIAVQDLQPLSGQGLGTGTQSVVLDEAAKGQGLAVWSQQWEHAVNQYALDDRTTYAIKTHDIRDREREAKVSLDLATVATLMLQVGLSPAQIINLLVDWNQLPPEYRVENVDLTPTDSLSDDEKPELIEAEVAAEPQEPESPEIVTDDNEAQPEQDMNIPEAKALMDTMNAASKALADYVQAETAAETARRLEIEGIAAEKAKKEAFDSNLLQTLKALTEAAQQPEVKPIVHTDPALLAAIKELAKRPAIAPSVVFTDPALNAKLDAVVAETRARTKQLAVVRKLKITKRDTNGRVLEWEEK